MLVMVPPNKRMKLKNNITNLFTTIQVGKLMENKYQYYTLQYNFSLFHFFTAEEIFIHSKKSLKK